MADKKILVIGSLRDDDVETQSLQDMVSFVGALSEIKDSSEVFGCHLDEVGYVIDQHDFAVRDLKNGRDFKDYDFVFFRGKLAASINVASTAAQYLKQHSIPHVNTAYSSRRAVGKIPQMFQLNALGLPIPKTVSAPANYLPELIAEHLQFPVIVKDVQGAHGNDNHLVRDEAQLRAILERSPDITFMAQEFIDNDGDYRVLLIGPEVAIIHRRGSDDSHLNNTSAGAKASLVEVKDFSPKIIEESRKFAASCQYEIAGVDVILDKNTGEHYYLEINSQPQLMTGAFVEEKQKMLSKYFIELLRS